MNGLNSNDRELLARLIERFNQIENNAKRIDELPAIASLAGDSKLHVSVNGISYSMTVQELLSAIESRKYDHITFINNLEINGTTLTADSAGWVIQDVVYNLTNPFEEIIPYASAGYQRTDLLIATTNNDFLVIQGDENEGISFAPPLPSNTVLVTTLDVTDNSINSSPNPIGNDNFKIKNESNFVKAVGNNPNDYIESFWLNTEASHIVLESIAEIKSLVLREGFKAYPGKQIIITNNGVSDLKIKHGHLSNVKFVFANNMDYIAKPKETVVFYLSEDLTQAHFLSSSIVVNAKRIYTMSDLFTITNTAVIGYKSIAVGVAAVSFTTETNTTNPNELISKPIFRWFGSAPFNCKLTKVVMTTNTSTQNNHLAIIKGNYFSPPSAVKQLVYDLGTSSSQSAEVINPSALTTLNKGDYIGVFAMTQLTSGTTAGWYHLEFEEID